MKKGKEMLTFSYSLRTYQALSVVELFHESRDFIT